MNDLPSVSSINRYQNSKPKISLTNILSVKIFFIYLFLELKAISS
jgi:hypothetical protein